ncbi:MAG: hypothetical protein ACREDQ_10930 [Limisphaerales bacterium]
MKGPWLVLFDEDAEQFKRHPPSYRFGLEALDSKAKAIKALHQRGCKLDIVSYWVSNGEGGPALWPYQMFKLGELGIEVWWDIYSAEEDEM